MHIYFTQLKGKKSMQEKEKPIYCNLDLKNLFENFSFNI